jgi:hypothetical protein
MTPAHRCAPAAPAFGREKRLVMLALAATLAACGPRDVQRSAALVGRWQGHVAWRDATTPVVLDVFPSAESLAATFTAPALGVDDLPVGRFAYDPPRVHFVVCDAAGAFAFDGWLRRGLVVGAFSSPALGGERNPSRLPQLSLQQPAPARHRSPFPPAAAVDSVPPPARLPQRSLGAWLLARLAR